LRLASQPFERIKSKAFRALAAGWTDSRRSALQEGQSGPARSSVVIDVAVQEAPQIGWRHGAEAPLPG
jgi:hypothetical protein